MKLITSDGGTLCFLLTVKRIYRYKHPLQLSNYQPPETAYSSLNPSTR